MESPWLIAFLDPLNFAMLIASTVAGLIAAWWLFPVGLLFWLLMMLNIVRDPSLRLNEIQAQQKSGMNERLMAQFERIQRSQRNLFNTISATEPAMRQALRPIQFAVNELASQAFTLCKRMTPVDNYIIVTMGRSNPDQELAKITEQIKTTPDAQIKKQYEESAQSLQIQINRLQDARIQLQRADATLASLSNEINAALTEVAHFQSIGVPQTRKQVPAVIARLHQEADQLKNFDKM